MTSRLDDMLALGERVVYRQSRSRFSLVRVVLVALLVGVLFWGLFIATAAPRVTWPFGVALSATLASLLSIWLQPDPAIATEQRLLYDRGPWAKLRSRPRLIAIPLAEIAEISGIESGWYKAPRLRLTDGRVIGIGNIADPKRLAKALASARGASPENPPDTTGGPGDDP